MASLGPGHFDAGPVAGRLDLGSVAGRLDLGPVDSHLDLGPVAENLHIGPVARRLGVEPVGRLGNKPAGHLDVEPVAERLDVEPVAGCLDDRSVLHSFAGPLCCCGDFAWMTCGGDPTALAAAVGVCNAPFAFSVVLSVPRHECK